MIIHQIWLGDADKILSRDKILIEQNKIFCDNYSHNHIFWSYDKLEKELLPNFISNEDIVLLRKKYSDIRLKKCYSAFVDIFKIAVVYFYGGMYIDTDYEIITNDFEKDIKQRCGLNKLGIVQHYNWGIYAAGLYYAESTFQNQHIKSFIDGLFDYFLSLEDINDVDVRFTGPEGINKVIKTNEVPHVSLGQKYMAMPYGANPQDESSWMIPYKDAYLVHYWSASWH